MENGLDIRELERLVEAYYACGLSREDEDCLRRVLVATGLRSEAIDRCRLAMGLEVVMGNDASAHVSKKHRRLRFFIGGGICCRSNRNRCDGSCDMASFIHGRPYGGCGLHKRHAANPQNKIEIARNTTAMVFQQFNLYPHKTVLQT